MTPFLILGYPRSRTAWLANFLSYGNIACGHEMLSECRFPDHLPHCISELGAEFCGTADTFASFWYDQLRVLMPGAAVVVVRRHLSDVKASLISCGHPSHSLDILEDGLQQAESDGALKVSYEDLDSQVACRAIQQHVAPGEPFDVRRYRMLRGMNVQVTPARWRELEEAAAKNVPAIL